jgi:hypothetical protein
LGQKIAYNRNSCYIGWNIGAKPVFRANIWAEAALRRDILAQEGCGGAVFGQNQAWRGNLLFFLHFLNFFLFSVLFFLIFSVLSDSILLAFTRK